MSEVEKGLEKAETKKQELDICFAVLREGIKKEADLLKRFDGFYALSWLMGMTNHLREK